MKRTVLIIVVLLTAIVFAAQTPVSPSGDGSVGNPYQIASIENLYWLKVMGFPGYCIQTADIDASETSTWNSDGSGGYYGWDPIDNTGGSGHYDGQGYVIENLYINRSSENNVGLFGTLYGPVGVGNKATLSGIRLKHVDITGSQDVGGIVGIITKYDISDCSVHGEISGITNVGGIAGRAQGEFGTDINIEESASSAYVTSYQNSGVLFGQIQKSTMSNCFAKGAMIGLMNSNNGGMIGYVGESTLAYCYSASSVTNGGGMVGGSDASGEGGSAAYFTHFDYEASGQFMSALGDIRTTAQMKTQSTYTAWDFTSTWSIEGTTNDGYPILQNISEESLPITLEKFTAEYIKGKVEITWATESEENNASFLIYRNDEVIAMIDGAGTTTETQNYSYIDEDVVPGMTYIYKLGDLSYANELVVHEDHSVSVMISENDTPQAFALNANYPNPFNPTTIIPYELSSEELVILNIYDMNGKLVRTLVNENTSAGYHEVVWDGKNNAGLSVNSGMYISRLIAGEYSDSRKMLMVK